MAVAALALLSLLAQVSFDRPFVAKKAVCFRAELGPKSTPKAPVYKKAELVNKATAAECAGKGVKLAALCDAFSRTQNHGAFKALWRSE